MTKAPGAKNWVTRGVLGIVLATFFSDVGHEMATATLPMYLGAIGLGAAALGFMEGLADLLFSLSKLAGGWVGHHTDKKRGFATLGYLVTALGTGAIALTQSLAALVSARSAAWLGRGFRSPLRDFMLADEVGPTHFGRAYGIERAADMLGGSSRAPRSGAAPLARRRSSFGHPGEPRPFAPRSDVVLHDDAQPAGGAPGASPRFAPFLFLACQGNSVNDTAYLLGLSDDDPHRIVLRKGTVAVGSPDSEGPNVLLASGESFSQGTWLHLRLDVIVNDNGDVVLKVLRNDLAAHPLGSPPDWQPVPGMVEFIDDHLGINSGSQPLTSGRGGFGMAVADVTRRGYFDHLELLRQV